MAPAIRAAVYARVSTLDQEPENQRQELPERYQDMRRRNRRQNEHAERLMMERRQQDDRRTKGGR